MNAEPSSRPQFGPPPGVRLRSNLVYLARRRHCISRGVAVEIVRTVIEAYLGAGIGAGDLNPESHLQSILARLHRACHDAVGAGDAEMHGRGPLSRPELRESHEIPTARSPDVEVEGPLALMMKRFDGRQLIGSLAHRRPLGRSVFRLITEEGVGREELWRRCARDRIPSGAHTVPAARRLSVVAGIAPRGASEPR